MSDESVWSYYWNCEGEFTKGPQKCACGGTVDCKDRDKHISDYIKKQMKGKERYNA